MAIINSVLGPLDTSNMGYTLMHEHILSAPIGVYQNYPELLGNGFVDLIVKGLKEAKEGGVETVVDASTFDLGRDASLLAEVSRRSGVNVITCTGWWLSDPSGFFYGWPVEKYTELFVKEIDKGIGDTGIKAGILKSAADHAGITGTGETILRAVARAHIRTGVPILLHSFAAGEVGRDQVAILKEEGVNCNRVKIDHCLDTADVEYLTWLLEQGCYLGLDRLPGLIVSEQAKARTAKALIDAGWAHRLLFSHDTGLIVYAPDMPPKIREFIEKGSKHQFLHLKNVFFPLLREMGVPDSVLNSLCVDNPRNFFEGAHISG